MQKKISVCNFLNLIFGKFVSFLAKTDLGNTIAIYRIEKDCAWLDLAGKYKLYGLKIEGDDNTVVRFAKQMELIIPHIRSSEKSDITIFFVKREQHQAVYVYAFDKRIIGQLSNDFGIPHMDGEMITASLLDVLLAQQYVVKDARKSFSGLSTTPFIPYGLEMSSGKFREKAMVAVDNIMRDYTIYQGDAYESIGEFDPILLFKLEWEGCFGLWINFSSTAVESRIHQYESTAKFSDQEFSAECTALIKKEDADYSRYMKEQTIVANSILILKEEKSLTTVSNALNIQFSKNYLTGPGVVAKTLLMSRDSGFDALLPKESVLRYLASPHKSPTPLEYENDFHGLDVSGNFVDISFADNYNPHAILTGRTGTGKSVQVLLILEKILGWSHVSKKCDRFYKTKVRYTDVGYTSGKFVEALKSSYPSDVEVFGSDVSKLRFGLFGFDLLPSGKVPEEEENFLISFLSFALQIEEMDPIVGLERSLLTKGIQELFGQEQGAENQMFVEDLEKRGGYEHIIREVLNAGFSHKTKLKDLSSEFDFLKKPVLSQLIQILSVKASNPESSAHEKKGYDSLITKLHALETNDMINLLPNVRLSSNKQFFHIDFHAIKKDMRAFNICYWMIMKIWLKQMEQSATERWEKGLKEETVLFIIEEAHNFFKYSSFEEMFVTIIKEVRKFGGRIFFVTQDIYDVPEKIYQEISTKMFVSTAKEKERWKTIAKKVYPQKDMTAINEVIDQLDDRMLLILNDRGAIGCKMVLEANIWFYKPKKIA